MPNTTFKSKVRVGDGLTMKDRATVTQATSATTAVTINANAGSITTVTQNIAAAGEVQFTVNNSKVEAGAAVVVAVASGSTGGTTVANVTAVAAGSFQITLTNLHASTAETGAPVINFAVINQALATAA
jgi:hypothetical protein